VAVGPEIIEELPPDLVDAAHIRSGISPLNRGRAAVISQRICSDAVPVCPERRFLSVSSHADRHGDGRAALHRCRVYPTSAHMTAPKSATADLGAIVATEG
jgi:hypothetical protein